MTLPQPEIRPTGETVRGRPTFEVIHGFTLTVPMGSGSYRFRIPKGFITDFASVPRPLWWLINPMDPHIIVASLIHDDLYGGSASRVVTRIRETVENVEYRQLSRFMCDAWFRCIMDLYGAPWWKQLMAFYAVRLGGRGHYTSGRVEG